MNTQLSLEYCQLASLIIKTFSVESWLYVVYRFMFGYMISNKQSIYQWTQTERHLFLISMIIRIIQNALRSLLNLKRLRKLLNAKCWSVGWLMLPWYFSQSLFITILTISFADIGDFEIWLCVLSASEELAQSVCVCIIPATISMVT